MFSARPVGPASAVHSDGRRPVEHEGRVEEAKGSAKKTVDRVADTLTGRHRNPKT